MYLKNRQHITVTLPKTLIHKIRYIRNKTGTPISQQVERGIMLYLEQHGVINETI